VPQGACRRAARREAAALSSAPLAPTPQGVPAELRAPLWLRVSGAEAAQRAAGPGYYAALLARAPSAADAEAERQIELDLGRTFGTHPWLRCEPARDALRRVLAACARANPGAGYCQSMNYVAAFALLSYRADEEACFWLARACFERMTPPRTYARDLGGLHAELRVLSALLRAKLPRLAATLQRMGADASLFATDWLLCAFTCTLPAESCARVWDAWLCEGSKVLIRVALALLRAAEPRALKATELGGLVDALRATAAEAHDRDALMDAAFNDVGSLPLARVLKLRSAASAELDAERAQLAARRAMRAS